MLGKWSTTGHFVESMSREGCDYSVARTPAIKVSALSAKRQVIDQRRFIIARMILPELTPHPSALKQLFCLCFGLVSDGRRFRVLPCDSSTAVRSEIAFRSGIPIDFLSSVM